MPANTYDSYARELIGLKTVVSSRTDPALRCIAGTIRDETKNMLHIETKGRILKVPKENTTLLIELEPRETVTINGDHLRFRPEDRVKKGLRQ